MINTSFMKTIKKNLVPIGIVWIMNLLWINLLMAQTPGTLVPDFGTGGVVYGDYDDLPNNAYASVIQPDGKILLAGTTALNTSPWPTNVPTLMRFLPTGALDLSFGVDGVVLLIPIAGEEWIEDVILQPDEKFLTIGYAEDGAGVYTGSLIRWNPDGTRDNTFGTNGKVTLTFGSGDAVFGEAVAVHPDGRIIALSMIRDAASNNTAGITMLNANGSLYTDFGTGGKLQTNPGGGDNFLNNIEVIDNDHFLIGGLSYETPGPVSFVTLAQFHMNGNPDYSFGIAGVSVVEINMEIMILAARGAMTVDDQGRILYGTFQSGIQSDDFALFRFHSYGYPDNTFGAYGLTVTDMPHDAYINAVTVQPDGKIVAGGHSLNNGSWFAMVRYEENGDPDLSFGTDGTGIVLTNFTPSVQYPNNWLYDLHMNPEGYIIATGIVNNTDTDNDFTVACYYSGLNVGTPPIPQSRVFSIYPNPFSNHGTLSCSFPDDGIVALQVFSLSGTLIREISLGWQEAGTRTVYWDAAGIPPGSYILQLSMGTQTWFNQCIIVP